MPEYKGEQSGAIVAPEKTDKPAYTGTQSGAIVEPEQVAPQPEYKGTQAGAIVEPETQPSLPEYKGEQSGAVVAPETNAKTRIYWHPIWSNSRILSRFLLFQNIQEFNLVRLLNLKSRNQRLEVLNQGLW